MFSGKFNIWAMTTTTAEDLNNLFLVDNFQSVFLNRDTRETTIKPYFLIRHKP